MGYSTTLYAVDLEILRSAVGSQNADLVDAFRRLAREQDSVPSKVDPTQGPRVKLTLNSEIILNGQLVSWEEYKVALCNPKWKGTYLYEFQEPGKRKGVWSKPGSFAVALGEALAADPNLARAWSQMLGTMVCDSEEELRKGWEDVDEIPADQALAELIAGKFTCPDHSYGSALEQLCQTLGTRVGTISGKNRLKGLKLDTPLSQTRLPVPLPEIDEFPYISYLTADELQREVERVRALDLSYPKSEPIERERRSFLQCLEAAAEKRLGIMAFYY